MRWWWIGLLLWAAAACDDAPGGARDLGAPDGAPDRGVDGGQGPGVGEPCPEGRCALGADCAAGRCTRACAGDEDCSEAGLVCVGSGDALGQCAPTCAQAVDCLPGERCATLAPGLGACVPPGPSPAGEACAADGDCDSRVCSAGVCLALCSDGCGPGEACLALHTQAVCVTAGAGEDEAGCSAGSDCGSGVCRGGRCTQTCPDGACPHDRVCRPYQTLALCERLCASSADCGEGAVCVLVGGLAQCLTRGSGDAGEPCAGAGDCASGVCTVDDLCAAPCDVDGSCPAGSACRTDLTGSTCRPAGLGGLGEPCAEDLACASGICAAGRCSVGCAAGACPAGLRCLQFLAGAFCFAPCRDTADCPQAAYCEPGFAEGPTCFWRGPVADDGACGRHADCASGRCSQGRCLPACPDGRCPGDRECAAFDTGAWCTPRPAVVGAACAEGADCGDGLGCVAGLCLPGCEGGCPAGTACAAGLDGATACHPRCAVDLPCRPGAACARFDGPTPVCVAAGGVPPDGACTRSMDCRDGLCLEGRCRAACPEGACLGGTPCVGFQAGAWCMPGGGAAAGAACASAADCAGAPCVGRRCAPPCDAAGACPDGTRCLPTRLGPLCQAPCDPVAGAGCAPDEACAPAGGRAEGRCAEPDGAALGADCGVGCAPPGRCVAEGDTTRCRAPCAVDGDCADAASCVRLRPTDALGVCLPAGPAPTGAPCAVGADCAGGACAAPGGRCGRPCDADGDCRGDDRCVGPDRDPFTADGRCAPRCEADEGCPDGLICRRDGRGRGACWEPAGP